MEIIEDNKRMADIFGSVLRDIEHVSLIDISYLDENHIHRTDLYGLDLAIDRIQKGKNVFLYGFLTKDMLVRMRPHQFTCFLDSQRGVYAQLPLLLTEYSIILEWIDRKNRRINKAQAHKYLSLLESLTVLKTEDDDPEIEAIIYELPRQNAQLQLGDTNYYNFAVRGNFCSSFIQYLKGFIDRIPLSVDTALAIKLFQAHIKMEEIYFRKDEVGNKTMRTVEDMLMVKDIVFEAVALASEIYSDIDFDKFKEV